jgi:hypothetical protein
MARIELDTVKTICLSFIHEKAYLEFDSQFCVPLDRKQLQEVRDYCDRAMEILIEVEKTGEKQ